MIFLFVLINLFDTDYWESGVCPDTEHTEKIKLLIRGNPRHSCNILNPRLFRKIC